MLNRSILPIPTFDHYCYSGNGEPSGEPSGNGGGGGNEGGGGSEGGGSEPPKGTLTEAQFNERMRQRVNETKDATEKRIASDLGVPLEEAKRLIAEAKKREDDEKSDAQREKEAAAAEKAAAEAAKGESARAQHSAKVEREILRHVNLKDEKGKDLDDDVIDAKVARIARLVDVEVGAEADAIKAAVKTLKDEEPSLFGAAASGKGGTPPPTGDPQGTPPKQTGAEGAFDKGKKRAQSQSGVTGYPILEGTASAPASN